LHFEVTHPTVDSGACQGIYTFLYVISCNYVLQAALQWTLLIASHEEFGYCGQCYHLAWTLLIASHKELSYCGQCYHLISDHWHIHNNDLSIEASEG